MIKLVDLDKQDSGMQQDILAGIKEVIQSKNFINGPKVRELEKRWASLSNTEHAIGCSNGTSALEIALKSCGVGAGDEVIVPAMTFIATAEAVANVGAKPVFVDIGTDGTIDVTKMKEAITSSTRAVIPVHLYGNICDMKSIISVCQNKDIYVIEDCAQAHGIKLAGDIGCFSFFPGKNIGAYGDAGMIVTNSEELAKRCRMMINHGREGKFGHTIPGGNYRMDDIQAAVLLVKERQWEKIIKDRFANVRGYWKLLGKEPQNSAPSHLHLFTILCKCDGAEFCGSLQRSFQ